MESTWKVLASNLVPEGGKLMGSIQTHSCRNCLEGAWRWRICKQYFPWKMIPLSSPYIPSWKHTNSSGIIWKKLGSSMAVSNFDLQSWKPITFDHELIGKVLNGGNETRVSAIVASKFDIVSFGYKQTAVYFTIRLYWPAGATLYLLLQSFQAISSSIQVTASCCNRRAETCPTYIGRRPLHHMEGSHPLWQFLPVSSTVPWRWFFNACCNLKSAANGLVAGCNTPQWRTAG